jgi:EmrB/QacA subfamily drug resistance transporter
MRTPCDQAVIAAGSADSPCTRRQGRWVLVATIVASSMAFIDSTVVNVALPALQTTFGASVAGVQWVVESYGLALAALILVGGSMGDLLGRRRMFLLGTLVFASASAWCGLAPTLNHLIAARTVQGIGAAFLVPGSLSLISASFAPAERGRAIGTWSGFTAITTAIGPVIGGWVIEHLSWRWGFFMNLPLAVLVVVVALWRVPESRGTKSSRIDWLGAMTATFSLTALVFGFVESSNLGWKSLLVIASLVAGFAAGAAFLVIERRTASPMVPLELFGSRTFAGANLLTFFLYCAVGMFFFVLPLNLIQVQGYSPTASGGAILPFIVLMFVLSRWSGGLVHRYGARRPLMIGPTVMALGFLLFSIPSVGGSYWTSFFPAILVLGFGMAISVAPLTTTVMGAVDEDHVGAASGINNAVARLAGVLAIAVLGVVMITNFGIRLDRGLAGTPVSSGVRTSLQAERNKLAGLKPPSGLDQQTTHLLESEITAAFVSSFRLMMWIFAALALASAATAWRWIPLEPVARRPDVAAAA